MIHADYLTPEHELVRLVRDRASIQTEARVRETCRYKVTYRERDPFDDTPDAYDTHVGYGPTYQEAYARAYGQSYAAERDHQYREGLQ